MNNMFSGVRDVFENAFHDVSQRFDPNRRQRRGSSQAQQQQQQRRQQQQQQPPTTQRAPPASIKALRKLPVIRVSPEDLVDPNNRECCICLEENKLDDKVVRLPCAHIFHRSCIVDWLAHHSCTCPVCRYELPTDDEQYEAGRVERMKLRKPRYAMHELRRMPVSELLGLHRGKVSGVFDKKDLIQDLVDNDWIDVIPSPEPVEYRLDALKKMKIGELKRTMEEAGVFFRREDVVEKSDMITVFENSGRLVLIHPEPEEASTLDAKEVACGQSEADITPSDLDSNDTPMKEDWMVVETVGEDLTSSEEDQRYEEIGIKAEIESPIVMFPDKNKSNTGQAQGTTTLSRSAESMSSENDAVTCNTQTSFPNNLEEAGQQQLEDPGTTAESSIGCDDTNESVPLRSSEPESDTQEWVPMEIDEPNLTASMNLVDQGVDLRETFDHYGISHLRTLARDLNVDLSHCLERDDMIDTFVNAGITGTADPLALQSLMFSSWSVSQLRAVASEINVDLSECTTGDEMIERILHSGNEERPYLRKYLRSLAPLTSMSLSGLRAIARELSIDISDCLEKKEIIQRLITRSR